MEDTTSTALTVAGNKQLNINLFTREGNDNSVKKITNLDLNNESDVDLLINADTDVDFRLNEEIGTEIPVVGYLATERVSEEIDEETGEVYNKRNHVLILFDINGNSHVTGSNACFKSFETILSFGKFPSKENPLVLIPIKVDAKEKGHSYLKLKLAPKGE